MPGIIEFPKLVKDVIYHGRQGDYARVTIAISMIAPPAEAKQYSEPRTGATPPPTYSCVAAHQAEATTAKTPQKAAAAPTPGPSALKVSDKFAPVTAIPTNQAVSASGNSLTGKWMPVIPIVLAAVVLVGTARQTLVATRRRRSPRN
jgi:hypothetical protein